MRARSDVAWMLTVMKRRNYDQRGGLTTVDTKDSHPVRKVLIVDDSQLCLEMEAAILAREGFDVRTAATIDEFDRILHAWSPDIVLTDVKMPEMQGTDLCRYVRRHVRSHHVPV